MILENLQKQITDAMKSRDEIRLSTLKLLLTAITYEKIAKQHELSGEEELAVVRREAKKRKDAIEVYEKAKATDRAEKEKQELAILEEYLPEEITSEELTRLVNEAIKKVGASTISDMGKVIGLVMKEANGNVDGGKVSAVVRQKLNNQ